MTRELFRGTKAEYEAWQSGRTPLPAIPRSTPTKATPKRDDAFTQAASRVAAANDAREDNHGRMAQHSDSLSRLKGRRLGKALTEEDQDEAVNVILEKIDAAKGNTAIIKGCLKWAKHNLSSDRLEVVKETAEASLKG